MKNERLVDDDRYSMCILNLNVFPRLFDNRFLRPSLPILLTIYRCLPQSHLWQSSSQCFAVP